MRTGMGSIFRELCRWEVGGTSGTNTSISVSILTLNTHSILSSVSRLPLTSKTEYGL